MIYTPIRLHLIKAEAEQKRWPSYAIELNLCVCGEGAGSPFAYFTKVALFRRERERINGRIEVAKEVTNVFRVEKGFKGVS
jgi:hypothetical protein